MKEERDGGKTQRPALLARLKLPWRAKSEKRCPICGETIVGEGVQRYGARFCGSWHADFYHPPLPWWQRLRWPDDEDSGGGGSCCC